MHGPVCKIVLVLAAIFVTLAISGPIHTGTANAAQRSSAPATDSAQIDEMAEYERAPLILDARVLFNVRYPYVLRHGARHGPRVAG